MAAGMESGLFVPETVYDCQYDWTKLPDRIRYDWTSGTFTYHDRCRRI